MILTITLDKQDALEEQPDQLYLIDEEDTCAICGSTSILHEGRCTTCLECGWSKCNI